MKSERRQQKSALFCFFSLLALPSSYRETLHYLVPPWTRRSGASAPLFKSQTVRVRPCSVSLQHTLVSAVRRLYVQDRIRCEPTQCKKKLQHISLGKNLQKVQFRTKQSRRLNFVRFDETSDDRRFESDSRPNPVSEASLPFKLGAKCTKYFVA